MKKSTSRYPHVRRKTTELLRASDLTMRALSEKLDQSDIFRLHSWIYGRSSPTLKECARLSILEKTLLRKKESIETIFREWIEATKPEEDKESRRGNAWLESQKLSQKELDVIITKAHDDAKTIENLTPTNEHNSKRNLIMFQVAKFIPHEIPPELSIKIAGHLADFFLVTEIEVLNDEKTKTFIHAAVQFFLANQKALATKVI